MGSEVQVDWLVPERPLTDEQVVAAVVAALCHGQRSGLSLAVILVNDATLAQMHERWLDDPSVTDVISFDLGQEESEGPAGEVYASVDRARAMAAERGVDAGRELALYLVHGTLHLCGYDDVEAADRRRMRTAERTVMDSLGYPEDTLPHDVER